MIRDCEDLFTSGVIGGSVLKSRENVMGYMQCETKWRSGLAFDVKIRDHQMVFDAKKESGGQDLGPTPKEVLLASICTCSGIDVASILQKMRVNLLSCEVNANSETTTSYPSVFTEVKIQFRIEGPDIKVEQAMKACNLSMTKYCGVSAMVAGTSPITYEVFLNSAKVGEGRAQFERSEA